MVILCSSCGATMAVDPAYAGCSGRCSQCDTQIIIPMDTPDVSPPLIDTAKETRAESARWRDNVVYVVKPVPIWLVYLLATMTMGIYLIFWVARIQREWQQLGSEFHESDRKMARLETSIWRFFIPSWWAGWDFPMVRAKSVITALRRKCGFHRVEGSLLLIGPLSAAVCLAFVFVQLSKNPGDQPMEWFLAVYLAPALAALFYTAPVIQWYMNRLWHECRRRHQSHEASGAVRLVKPPSA